MGVSFCCTGSDKGGDVTINGQTGLKLTVALLIVWVVFIALTVLLACIKIPTPPELNQADTSLLAFLAGAGLLSPGSGVVASGAPRTSGPPSNTLTGHQDGGL